MTYLVMLTSTASDSPAPKRSKVIHGALVMRENVSGHLSFLMFCHRCLVKFPESNLEYENYVAFCL